MTEREWLLVLMGLVLALGGGAVGVLSVEVARWDCHSPHLFWPGGA